ncbi:MAG: carbon-nitrogen family hydrolase [Acidobacteria bacterium]|nr:carbon-nitrogen family hydrolase [Acidobacteriota bacterium]
MRVIGCQLDIRWEDKEANHARVRKLLEKAAPGRDSLVVLPEMFATGFSMNVDRVTDDRDRTTQKFLSRLAVEYKAFVLGGVVTRCEDARGLNQAVIYKPSGRELARYSKLHPFSYAGETGHFAPGTGIETFVCNSFKVAPFICYDLRFPEAFRAATRRGAQLLVVIANWPAARESHWTRLLEARAIENQAFVIGINRCGSDPNHAYSGGSRIIDPRGKILRDAGSSERWIEAELDLRELIDYRKAFPALNDMRDDL